MNALALDISFPSHLQIKLKKAIYFVPSPSPIRGGRRRIREKKTDEEALYIIHVVVFGMNYWTVGKSRHE